MSTQLWKTALNHVKSDNNMIAITTDAWSSRILKRYVAITALWFYRQWISHSAVLYYRQFYTPHTGEVWATVLFEVLCDWGIEKNRQAITTDNGSEVICVVKLVKPNKTRVGWSYDSFPSKPLRQRCITYIINIEVEACRRLIQKIISAVTLILNFLRVVIKRRNFFEST